MVVRDTIVAVGSKVMSVVMALCQAVVEYTGQVNIHKEALGYRSVWRPEGLEEGREE